MPKVNVQFPEGRNIGGDRCIQQGYSTTLLKGPQPTAQGPDIQEFIKYSLF